MSQSCIRRIESYWKELTVSSNTLFDKKDYKEALNGYTQALYRAEVLNNHGDLAIDNNIPFMQVFIISCNNLANTYEALDSFNKADKMWQRPVYYLLHLTLRKKSDPVEIKTELRQAVLNYTNFAKRNKMADQKTKRLVKNIKTHFEELKPINS